MEEGFRKKMYHQHIVAHYVLEEECARLPKFWFSIEALQVEFTFVDLLCFDDIESGQFNPLLV